MLLLLTAFAFPRDLPDLTSIPVHYAVLNELPGSATTSFDSIFTAPLRSDRRLLSAINETRDAISVNITALLRLFEMRIPAAVHALGDLHLYGRGGFTQNVTRAAALFIKACKRGFPDSFARLSLLYRFGIGVERDEAQAIVYREAACVLGSASGCIFAAHYSAARLGNYDIGVRLLFHIAEVAGRMQEFGDLPTDPVARLSPGLTLVDVKQEDREEFKVLRYKAARGDPEADVEMAMVYYYGQYGEQVDLARARQILERHEGLPMANALLARMYHFGNGVPVDTGRARQYYERAGDRGDALNNLGVLRQQEGEEEEAFKLFEKAAAVGQESAMFNVAMRKVSQGKVEEALGDLRQLADKGMIQACLELAILLVQSDAIYEPKEAWERLSEAAACGPWLRMCYDAETYWRNGNFAGAVMIWIEMAECGIRVAALNAGQALLELDKELPFADRASRQKLATMMFRRALALGDEEADGWLLRAYFARGKVKKLTHVMGVAESAQSFYSIADAHLRGLLAPQLVPTVGNLSQAIATDLAFVLPVLVLMPRVLQMFAIRLGKCITGRCDQEEIKDLRVLIRSFIAGNVNGLATLVGIACLIVLVRRRVASTLQPSV
jgi:TPR repeat protein